jgi:hypothetical protein
MHHQSKRCKGGAGDALSRVVVIGWLLPVCIALKLTANDRHTRYLAVGNADHVVYVSTDRIVIARCKIGIVGV